MISRLVIGVLSLGLLAALTWAVLGLPTPSGLTDPALEALSESGVEHPVTAVLLNYRGYDTLLELAVLLLSLVGVWSLGVGDLRGSRLHGRALVPALLRLLLPILVVSAGYLLWIGAFAPGGAFQGGALLGGAMVLGVLGGMMARWWRRAGRLRLGVATATLVFAGAALMTLGLEGNPLQYPEGQAGWWILLIEAAACLSIGLTLGLLYVGRRPREDEYKYEEEGFHA